MNGKSSVTAAVSPLCLWVLKVIFAAWQSRQKTGAKKNVKELKSHGSHDHVTELRAACLATLEVYHNKKRSCEAKLRSEATKRSWLKNEKSLKADLDR